jgi:hypothetical protein
MSDAARWIDDYTARASDLWDRGTRTSVELASRWGDRSLADSEWTVETVTTDVIEASEMLTPLIGEAVELWLEFVQRMLAQGERSDG